MSGRFHGNTSVEANADLDALWALVPGAGVIAGILASITAIKAEIAALQGGVDAHYQANPNAGSIVAAAGDLTGAIFVVGQYTGDSASGTLTTRTASQMIADAALAVGSSYMVRILNTGPNPWTLTGGADVTIVGSPTIGSSSWTDYLVRVTDGAAMSFQFAGSQGAGGAAKFRVPFVYGDDNVTGPGSFTHTVSAGVTHIEIEAWGAGGGAPGTSVTPPAGAGGGGAYVWAAKAVTPGDTLAIVTGAGAVSAHPAVAGADTTVDVTGIIAGGGFPAAVSGGNVNGGAGGLPQWDSGYVLVARGLVGQPGTTVSPLPGSVVSTLGPAVIVRGGDSPKGGSGAISFMALGNSQDGDGGTGTKLSSGGQPATQPGGGAANCNSAGQQGIDESGGNGLVIVWEYQ